MVASHTLQLCHSIKLKPIRYSCSWLSPITYIVKSNNVSHSLQSMLTAYAIPLPSWNGQLHNNDNTQVHKVWPECHIQPSKAYYLVHKVQEN